jgi:anaerobic carbon-monoxide dehydrogenase iron sulfur subunit
VAKIRQNQKVFVYDPSLCTGCRLCEMACSFWHCNVIDVERSRIKILFDSDKPGQGFAAVSCQHCEDPVCVAVCPSEAMQKDEESGLVTTNASKCIGCRMCIDTCPLTVPFFDEKLKVAIKCDFCAGDPECVKHCSSAALKLVPREEAIKINEKIYLSAKG